MDLMQASNKLFVNSFSGVQNGKDSNESYFCKLEHSMKTEIDHNVLDYLKSPNGN